MKKSKKKLEQRSDGTTPGHSPAVKSHAVEMDVSPRLEFADLISMDSTLARLPQKLHWVFLLIGSMLVVFLAVCTPPFQSPDEDAHFERAYQVSRGGLYGGKGGNVDRGIDEAQAPYSNLPFKTDARVTAADDAAAAKVMWTGETVYHDFPNTAVYPPIDYIPQALAVALGRIAGMSVVHTLILSRLLNGALAMFISAFALYWCRRGKLIMFAVLLMPMTMSLYGSCSQDALLISIACLAFAIVSRQISEGAPLSLRMTIVLASALLFVILARPPYVPLLLVLFIPGILPQWGKKPAWLTSLSLAGLLAVITVLWWILASPSPPPAASSNVNAGMQLQYILHNPGVIWVIITGIKIPLYIDDLVGILGWLDTPMPHPYYVVMELMLLVAMAGEMVYRSRFTIKATALILFATLSVIAGLFFIEYLIFSPVGSQVVFGVQSRYLIPPAIACGIGLPRLMRSDRGYWLATATVVLCQLLTLIYLPLVIIDRYYLITEQPNYITERLYFADALETQGKFDDAAREYRQVLAVMPSLYNVHNGLGNVYEGKGSPQDAIKEFRISLAMKPDQALPHFKIGGLLAGMHKFPEAIEEYSRALQFDPANANIHNDLGVILYQQGAYEKAAEQFSDAIRIDPNHANARKNLDIAEAQLKNRMVNSGRK